MTSVARKRGKGAGRGGSRGLAGSENTFPNRSSQRNKRVASEESEVNSDDSDSNNGEFEVEAIVGKKIKDGQVQYRVKWKGFDHRYITWEPAENLENAPKLIEKYEKSLEAAPEEIQEIEMEKPKLSRLEMNEKKGQLLRKRGLEEVIPQRKSRRSQDKESYFEEDFIDEEEEEEDDDDEDEEYEGDFEEEEEDEEVDGALEEEEEFYEEEKRPRNKVNKRKKVKLNEEIREKVPEEKNKKESSVPEKRGRRGRPKLSEQVPEEVKVDVTAKGPSYQQVTMPTMPIPTPEPVLKENNMLNISANPFAKSPALDTKDLNLKGGGAGTPQTNPAFLSTHTVPLPNSKKSSQNSPAPLSQTNTDLPHPTGENLNPLLPNHIVPPNPGMTQDELAKNFLFQGFLRISNYPPTGPAGNMKPNRALPSQFPMNPMQNPFLAGPGPFPVMPGYPPFMGMGMGMGMAMPPMFPPGNMMFPHPMGMAPMFGAPMVNPMRAPPMMNDLLLKSSMAAPGNFPLLNNLNLIQNNNYNTMKAKPGDLGAQKTTDGTVKGGQQEKGKQVNSTQNLAEKLDNFCMEIANEQDGKKNTA